MKIYSLLLRSLLLCLLSLSGLISCRKSVHSDTPPSGWSSASPRDEIAPVFMYHEKEGRDGKGSFIIQSDQRDYLKGQWYRKFQVIGGQHYKFEAWYKVKNVKYTRRSVYAKVIWRKDVAKGSSDPTSESYEERYGKRTSRPTTTDIDYCPGWKPQPAEDEYTEEQECDSIGWHKVTGVFMAPLDATIGVVELVFQWSPNSSVEWSQVSFIESEPPPPRKVRLAAIHYDPQRFPDRVSKTPEENLRLWEPYINEAGRQKADLVVLGEHIQSQGLGPEVKYAESVPGALTRQLGQYAKKNNLYIVAGLTERAGHKIMPVAVLIGPDGELVGKYNKTALTTGEVDSGQAAGTEFPVFTTRFGKVGMMICYDGEFVEASRQLSENGAEVIAWPCYGNPWKMAQAHSLFNQVYVVMSTYCAYTSNDDTMFGISGVFNREGYVIAAAKEFGTVALAEVDLNKKTYHISIGNFKPKIMHQRPVWKIEP